MGYSMRALRLKMAFLLGLLIGGATGSPAQEPPPSRATPPKATGFLPDEETFPTGEEGGPLADLTPVTVVETDDVLTRLRKEQFNTALKERDSMMRILEEGGLSYDVYFGNARRIRDAELDLAADAPARVDARRRYLGQLILAERRAVMRPKSGEPSDYYAARVRRLQGQIDLWRESYRVPRLVADGSPQAARASLAVPAANPPTLLDLKPIEARAEDSPLRRLQIERRNAALEVLRLLNRVDIEESILVLDLLHGIAERLAASSQDLAESDEDRIAPMEAWVAYMKELEAKQKLRVEAGATPRFVLEHGRFARIRAEIRLHQARAGGNTAIDSSPLDPAPAARVGPSLETLPVELSVFLGPLQISGNEAARRDELMRRRWEAAAESVERRYVWESTSLVGSPPYLIESVRLAFEARLEIAGSPADRAQVHERHVALARYVERFYQKLDVNGSGYRVHSILATEYRADSEIRQIMEITRAPAKQ
jgi:hypothetical protein